MFLDEQIGKKDLIERIVDCQGTADALVMLHIFCVKDAAVTFNGMRKL